MALRHQNYDTSRQLSQEQVDDLLRAVQLVPSSYGLQPYRFITVTDPAKLEQISRAAFGQLQIVEGIEADQYEIYVGETASQRAAYFADPVAAVNAFNSGL